MCHVLEADDLVGADPGIMKLGHPSTSTGTHFWRPPLCLALSSVHLEGGGAGGAGERDLEHRAACREGVWDCGQTVARFRVYRALQIRKRKMGKELGLFTILTPKADESSSASRILYKQSLPASPEPQTDLKTVTCG